MANPHVLLVFGGRSPEHDISVISAKNVLRAIDTSRFKVSICYVDKDGIWWLQGSMDDVSDKMELLPVLGRRHFITIPGGKAIQPDVLLPIMHGQNGEDGTVQGLAQLLGIPYVGPSLLSAAVTMDKDMTKKLLEHAGIPVVPWRTWLVQDQEPSYATISDELGPDVFVKPASAGSSIGVGHVDSPGRWSELLRAAAEHSDVVMIEKTIKAREIELAVLGNNRPRVSGAGEILPDGDFYSFEGKYAETSNSKIAIPADISAEVLEKLQNYALDAYRVTESMGMARVDFFIDEAGAIYLNEINSIPGFTNISMYPKLWDHEGVGYTELISELIDLALE